MRTPEPMIMWLPSRGDGVAAAREGVAMLEPMVQPQHVGGVRCRGAGAHAGAEAHVSVGAVATLGLPIEAAARRSGSPSVVGAGFADRRPSSARSAFGEVSFQR